MNDALQLVDNLLDSSEDPKELVTQMKAEQDAEIADLRSQGIVNAKTVQRGSTIYHRTEKNSDGTAARAKVTSIYTWKTRPDYFEIGWKHGMYTYGKIQPNNADQWTTIEPPRVAPKRRR